MTADLAMKIMTLSREGYKKKKLDNYKEIYKILSSFWCSNWEEQYHSQEEKNTVYKQINNMEL